MKIKKVVLPLALVASMTVGFAVGNALPRETTPVETSMEYENVKIYDSSEITYEILSNRNGKIIIEEVIGEVTSTKGDGEVLNCADPDYNYISYSNVKGAKKGDIILTYLIYNPDSNAEDDVILRYDYITNN